jgi:hypothetical protein
MAFTPVDPTKAEVRIIENAEGNQVFDFYFPQGPKGEPGGLTTPTLLTSITANLNTVTVPGLYTAAGSDMTYLNNWPIENTGGVLQVFQWSTSAAYTMQMYWPRGETSAAPNNKPGGRGVYTRTGNSSAWSVWSYTAPTRIDQSAGRAIYQWDNINSREQIIYGDTGWRDVWNSILAIDPNATKKAGFLGARIRRTLQHVHLDVGFNTTTVSTDWRAALLPTIHWYPDMPVNVQFSAAQTGSSGVIHFSPMNYIKNWSAGDVVIQMSMPCSQPWPTSLPGIPSTTNGTIPNI